MSSNAMGGSGMRSGGGGGASAAYNDGWESSRRGADDRNWSMCSEPKSRLKSNFYFTSILDSDYRTRDSYEDETQYDGEREDSDNESPHVARSVVYISNRVLIWTKKYFLFAQKVP